MGTKNIAYLLIIVNGGNLDKLSVQNLAPDRHYADFSEIKKNQGHWALVMSAVHLAKNFVKIDEEDTSRKPLGQ